MDDTSRKLIGEACENFQHVPYWFAQSALGVDDGGFASLYDSDTSGEFDGRFSSEIGADLLKQVLSDVGSDEFSANSSNLFNHDIMAGFDHRLSSSAADGEVSSMASKVADAAIAHVLQVFPSASAAGLARFRQPMADFFRSYMKSEIDFAERPGGPAAR